MIQKTGDEATATSRYIVCMKFTFFFLAVRYREHTAVSYDRKKCLVPFFECGRKSSVKGTEERRVYLLSVSGAPVGQKQAGSRLVGDRETRGRAELGEKVLE